MPTFGFSAFLKLLSLNPRPQHREVRVRLTPSGAGGYDFHRSLRLFCRRLLSGAASLNELLEAAEGLANKAEAKSAKSGIQSLAAWIAENPGEIVPIPPRTFVSPRDLFRVQFSPDFGIRMGHQLIAVHIWNTAKPDLNARMVYAALALLPDLYEDESTSPPDDFAVLSLPDGKLYRLSDVGEYGLIAKRVVSSIEELISDIIGESGFPDIDDPTVHIF